MELNEYQKKAMATCMPSCYNFSYMMLNLVGEVGEFASKVAKQIRKDNFFIGDDERKNDLLTNEISYKDYSEIKAGLKYEAGDILWQLAGLCKAMGWSLEDVAKCNLEKLDSRKKRGVIDGNGDNR